MTGDEVPLHQALFDAEVALSDRYPSLNPFSIRKMPFGEFCHVLEGTKQAAKNANRRQKRKNWVPATDSWF